jgi:hypothetical protein
VAQHGKQQLSDLRNDNRGDLRSNWIAEARRRPAALVGKLSGTIFVCRTPPTRTGVDPFINLKTAIALGPSVPATLFASADEVTRPPLIAVAAHVAGCDAGSLAATSAEPRCAGIVSREANP